MTEEFKKQVEEVHKKIQQEKEVEDIKVCEKSLKIAKDILNVVLQLFDQYDYYKKKFYRGLSIQSNYLGKWDDLVCMQNNEKEIGILAFRYPKIDSFGHIEFKGYPDFLEANEKDIDFTLINEVLKREDVYLEQSKDESSEYAEVKIIFPLSIFEPKFTPQEIRESARQKVLDRLYSHNISL